MKKMTQLLLFLIFLPLSSWTIADQHAALSKVELKLVLQQLLQSEDFSQRVEEVIIGFIEKQNQAQVDATGQGKSAKAASIPNVDSIDDYIRGSSSAAYSLIEYSDYECPFCKKFHHTAQQFIDDNADVNWVYRHFPLEFHNPLARLEAEASECAGALAGADSFWDFSDEIFARTKSNGKGLLKGDLYDIADLLDIDATKFSECLDSNQQAAKVDSHIMQGRAAGINGTPANFLRHNASGNTLVITGAQPLNELQKALDELKWRVK
ncbi:DsbA family protein [Oceanospirillaceae bacterium]|nr:DsbA family protein [Oceanospirillaceae bacterium]